MSIKASWAVLGVACVASLQTTLAASLIRERGMATVPFSGKTPNTADYRNVERAAEINAMERYIASTTSAELRNFQKIRKKVASDLSRYVLGVTPIARRIDPEAGTLTMVVRVDLNSAALTNAFRAHSAVASVASASRSYIGFIFVARQQAAITHYGPEASGLNASQESENGTNDAAKTTAGAVFSDQHTAITRTKAENSEIQRASTINYRVASSSAVNAAMTGVFANAGYSVVQAQFLPAATHGLINLKAFRSEYAQGNDLSSQTLNNAVQGAEEIHLRYLALGKLDIGMSNIDSQTGLHRVFVKVTGTLYYLGGLFPQTLVSVGPEMYSGLGPTESAAETNALTLAAKAAAKKMAQAMAADQVH